MISQIDAYWLIWRGFGFTYALVILVGLGIVLTKSKYFRERPKYLAGSYMGLLFAFWFAFTFAFITLPIHDYTAIATFVLAILVYSLVPRFVKPIKEFEDNIIQEIPVAEEPTIQELPIDTKPELKGVSIQVKIISSLVILSYTLAALSIYLKQYISLVCYAIAILAMCFLPLSTYLRKNPGRLSLAYIVFLSGSYLFILPSAIVGFALHYKEERLHPLISYAAPTILAISLLIYFLNMSNINSTLRNILQELFYKREARLTACNQMEGSSDMKIYKNKVYTSVFIPLIALTATILFIAYSIEPKYDTEFAVLHGFITLAIAVFILKSILPKAGLISLIMHHAIISSYLYVATYENIDHKYDFSNTIAVFVGIFLVLFWACGVTLAWLAYKGYCSVTKSKFVWGTNSDRLNKEKNYL